MDDTDKKITEEKPEGETEDQAKKPEKQEKQAKENSKAPAAKKLQPAEAKPAAPAHLVIPKRFYFCAITLVFFISIWSALAAVYVYDKYFAVKIAVVDSDSIRDYVNMRKKQYLANEITGQEFDKSLERIDQMLGRVRGNVVILREDAVVRNAEKIAVSR